MPTYEWNVVNYLLMAGLVLLVGWLGLRTPKPKKEKKPFRLWVPTKLWQLCALLLSCGAFAFVVGLILVGGN
jgi:hypothetical protein